MNKSLLSNYVEVILFNKPYDVLCQFTDAQNRPNLSHFISIPQFYACGRLDRDSEGLLILSNHGKLQHLISDPQFKLEKTYWVQVDGCPDSTALKKLRGGIELKDGMTKSCSIKTIPQPPVSPRVPPIRVRKNLPTSWLEITLTEGKNRQVRRMTAAIGFPTLRLIRHRIGSWSCLDLPSGEFARQKIAIDTLPLRWQQYLRDTKVVRRQRGASNKPQRRTPSRLRGAR